MITDLIVLASLACSIVFVAAWAARPDLRAWIERPKYHFQDAVREYDRTQPGGHRPEESRPHD